MRRSNRIRQVAATLALLAAPFVCSATAFAQASVVPCGDTTCAVYHVDLTSQELQLLATDDTGKRIANAGVLEQWATRQGRHVLFATNGGIFDHTYRPLGLTIIDGVQLVQVNRSSGTGNFYLQPNGVFSIVGGEAHIAETGRYLPTPGIRFAAQSGPLLVLDGDVNRAFHQDSANKLIRSGVGVASPTDVEFAISNGPISFYDFATLFHDTLHCRNALYLDGYISRMHVPEIHRNQRDGDFATMFFVLDPAPPKPRHNRIGEWEQK